MSKIKQQFSDLRKTTPKHVQWLLLAAAFVIVLILLTLLVGGWRKKADDIKEPNDSKLQLFVDPTGTLDWSDTPVDATRTEEYTITASAPVKILKVRTNSDIKGLSISEQCSTDTLIIDKDHGCRITIKYAPTANMATTGASLFVDWRGARETDSLKKTEKVTMVLGAVGEKKAEPAKPAPAPAPVKEPEPEPEPEPIPEPEPMPKPVKEEIKQDIEAIAPALPVISAPAPKPAPAPVAAPEPAPAARAESCSDFAFPGYNASGRQIGWIKPERGAYYFHPFSDKNCDSPTGTYNPDNGIITDIKDPSKKIGTDAEHIGYSTISGGTLPQLSSAPSAKSRTAADIGEAPVGTMSINNNAVSGMQISEAPSDVIYTSSGDSLTNTAPYDRSFILRQYKPIPATIVSEIRADPEALANNTLPVRATVDRNVYADNGRTVVIPAGTLLMGYVSGKLPGPYTSIGRMDIRWYQFILPNGVEFNFPGGDSDPFSADAQGRSGVPGRGSTDYLEQFVMPMLTAIVPAAVNMIAPVADKFVNQIDLDNNTVVQSGTVRSSELAKNEIITAWNQVAQKLLVDMMDNTVPPFSIAAGTRITVYSPMDLQVTCGLTDASVGKKCAIAPYSEAPRTNRKNNTEKAEDGSWVGQVRSFNMQQYCTKDKNGNFTANEACATSDCGGYDYRTILFYCQSMNYKAINNAKQEALWQNQQSSSNTNSISSMGGVGSQTYNEQVLGLKYDEDTGAIVNPFQTLPKEEAPATITCEDGTNPDANGCCTGEIYTDMGDQGFNCCPETGGDCFPPIL
ncbi:MAG: TrbI/VirB10 family protein [Alphaproteobacteria bacterium]|nr:TrbI/VirB10 family protein [Alphaproteobacteria bacterium]